MRLKRRTTQSCVRIILLTLACVGASSGARALAQTPAGQCEQTPVLYQLAHYTVEHVTVKPMVNFIPNGPVLDQSLAAAIAIEMPASNGVWTSRAFDTVWASRLDRKSG